MNPHSTNKTKNKDTQIHPLDNFNNNKTTNETNSTSITNENTSAEEELLNRLRLITQRNSKKRGNKT